MIDVPIVCLNEEKANNNYFNPSEFKWPAMFKLNSNWWDFLLFKIFLQDNINYLIKTKKIESKMFINISNFGYQEWSTEDGSCFEDSTWLKRYFLQELVSVNEPFDLQKYYTTALSLFEDILIINSYDSTSDRIQHLLV